MHDFSSGLSSFDIPYCFRTSLGWNANCQQVNNQKRLIMDYKIALDEAKAALAGCKEAAQWLKKANLKSKSIEWVIPFMEKGLTPNTTPPPLDISIEAVISVAIRHKLSEIAIRQLRGYLIRFVQISKASD